METTFSQCEFEPTVRRSFYVISPVKLLILTICTLGFYHVFWLYQNLKAHQQYYPRDPISPLFRTIFAPFFIHDLLKRAKAEDNENVLSDVAVVSFSMAYIILLILTTWGLVPNPQNHIILQFHVSLFSLPGILLLSLLFWMQLQLNKICGDKFGATNDSITIENFLWLGCFWICLVSIFTFSVVNKTEAEKWGVHSNISFGENKN
ncbi:MAG: hypothetical protein AAB680_06960 [Pseudomonadota bacterium]